MKEKKRKEREKEEKKERKRKKEGNEKENNQIVIFSLVLNEHRYFLSLQPRYSVLSSIRNKNLPTEPDHCHTLIHCYSLFLFKLSLIHFFYIYNISSILLLLLLTNFNISYTALPSSFSSLSYTQIHCGNTFYPSTTYAKRNLSLSLFLLHRFHWACGDRKYIYIFRKIITILDRYSSTRRQLVAILLESIVLSLIIIASLRSLS